MQPNTWTNFQNIPIIISSSQSLLLPNGGVLNIGGYDTNDNTYSDKVYYLPPNPNSSTPWQLWPSMITPRINFEALVYDGGVLVMGGSNNNSGLLGSVQYLASINGSWADWKPTIPRHMSKALIYQGNAVVIGGDDFNSKNSVQYLPPGSNQNTNWSDASDLLYSTHSASVALYNGGILIIREFFPHRFASWRDFGVYKIKWLFTLFAIHLDSEW